MKTENITVLTYDKNWANEFQKIKKELMEVLNNEVVAIEHVGSTSVEGLSAKPIIDIDIVIDSYDNFKKVVNGLEQIGYEHEGDLGIKDREAFEYSGKDHLMVHHIYVCPKNSQELKRHIIFRDYLRQNPKAIKNYSEVKEQGVRLFPNDIIKYMEYKNSCIKKLYIECGLITTT